MPQADTRETGTEAVERSLITLKALTYRPTGGIVAAPTTSLPERIGRRPKLGLSLLLAAGCCFHTRILPVGRVPHEARAWQEWLLQAVGSDVRSANHVWDARGAASPGMRASMVAGISRVEPVRMGNAASEQLQLDVYGEWRMRS